MLPQQAVNRSLSFLLFLCLFMLLEYDGDVQAKEY